MIKSSKQMRETFFQENPIIYQQYLDIKRINATRGSQSLERLNAIKAYAIDYSPFYAGFSLLDSFPIMTKLDYIEHRDAIRSREQFEQPFHISSTSGSTGIPFFVEQNFEKRKRVIAELKVFGEYAGFLSHEKMLQLRSYPGVHLDRRVDEQENIWRYDTSVINKHTIEKILQIIQEWKPITVFGYASVLDTICNYCIETNYSPAYSPKSILVGADKLMMDTANRIKSVFHCDLFDRYSDMELGILAQRRFGNNFRLNKASYYWEILDLNSDEAAGEHKVGRLVITDLFNHAFPMIRYDTGDLGTYEYVDGELELTEIFGRSLDTVYDVKGEMVNPHAIDNAMWGVQNVSQYQFAQKRTRKKIAND